MAKILTVEQFHLDDLGFADLPYRLPFNGHLVHVLGIDDQVFTVLEAKNRADDDTAVTELYFGGTCRTDDKADEQ